MEERGSKGEAQTVVSYRSRYRLDRKDIVHLVQMLEHGWFSSNNEFMDWETYGLEQENVLIEIAVELAILENPLLSCLIHKQH